MDLSKNFMDFCNFVHFSHFEKPHNFTDFLDLIQVLWIDFWTIPTPNQTQFHCQNRQNPLQIHRF